MRQVNARRTRAVFTRDPAPSRLSYKAQRLWLTPFFGAALRVGVPAFGIVMLIGLYLEDPENRQTLLSELGDVQHQIQDRPEFQIAALSITGASAAVDQAIRARVALDFPMSSFDLDLDAIRAQAETLPAVKQAVARVLSDGILALTIDERVPALVWQSRDGPRVIDADGYVIVPVDARAFDVPLPTIAGDCGDRAAAEALMLFDVAAPLEGRLRGLARMGERRWDVVFNDGRRILLPENGAITALERVIELHDTTQLLARGFEHIDVRLPNRLTIQMTPAALAAYRTLQQAGVVTVAEGQGG